MDWLPRRRHQPPRPRRPAVAPSSGGRVAWKVSPNGKGQSSPTAQGLDTISTNALAVTGRVYGGAAARGALFLRTDTELIRLIV
jgi:hypothetical protein